MKLILITVLSLGIFTNSNAMTKKLHERIEQNIRTISQSDENPVAVKLFNEVLRESKRCFSKIRTYKDGSGDTWSKEATGPTMWQSECEDFWFENETEVLVYRDKNWSRYYFAKVNFRGDYCDVEQPHGVAIYKKLSETDPETGLADNVHRIGVIATGEFETCYSLPVLEVMGINYKKISRHIQAYN